MCAWTADAVRCMRVHACKSAPSILVHGVLMYGCMDAWASVLMSAFNLHFFCVNDLCISECGFRKKFISLNLHFFFAWIIFTYQNAVSAKKKIISLNPKAVATCIHISAAFQDASAAKYLAMLASLPVRTRGSIQKNNLKQRINKLNKNKKETTTPDTYSEEHMITPGCRLHTTWQAGVVSAKDNGHPGFELGFGIGLGLGLA